MNTSESSTLVKVWNAGISLNSPTLEEIQKLPGMTPLRPVFSHSPYLLLGSGNLLVMLSLATADSDVRPIQSMSVVLTSDFFAAGSLVSTGDCPALKIFGISTGETAQGFLLGLRRQGIELLQLETEPAMWIIRVGGALAFKFRPLSPGQVDPDKSRMIQLEFNYGLPYKGQREPVLSVY